MVETFSAAPLNMISNISDLEIVVQDGKVLLYTATRAGGGILAFDVTGQMQMIDQEFLVPGAALPAEAVIERVTINGTTHLVVTGANLSAVQAYAIGGDGALAAPLQLPGSLAGAIAAQAVVQVGTSTYFYAAKMGESTIHVYSVAANGNMTLVGTRMLDGAHTGVDISALRPVVVGGNCFLVSLSLEADVIRAFPVMADGVLGQPQTLGAPNGLGVADPADIEVVELGGVTYLLVASTNSSSVSVISLSPNGAMTVTDHVIDTLDTRFQHVQAIAAVEVGDRVFVFAGGADDGLTVMVLSPDGRLLPCTEILQLPGMALDNITAIAAQVVDGQIEIFVTGEGTGITRIQIDPGTLTPIQYGGTEAAALSGSTGEDMIIGGDGAELLSGGGGADILSDGAGQDTLSGGAGEDLYVLSADGAYDCITDFQLGIDRIDLSAWGAIHSLDSLTITPTATGALVTWGGETLELFTPNGLPLLPGSLQLEDLAGLWHILPSEPDLINPVYGTNQVDALTGTAADEMFVVSTGADTIDGGAGFDCIVLTAATAGVRINLGNINHNNNIATGQVFISIEGIIGTGFSDTLTGNALDNRIEGRDGNDRLTGWEGNDSLYGGNGNDTLLGGVGADILDGGAGRDRATYRDAYSGVTANLGDAARNTGEAAGDSYVSIEDLEGSAFGDTLSGDGLANTIWGVDGDDWIDGRLGNDNLLGGLGNDTLVGGAGADRIDGGAGTDVASYETATAAVQIDMMSLASATGDTAGDVFVSIEGFVLTAFADSFLGSDLGDLVSGGGGNDTLTGRGGADWLSGGAGADTLYGGDGDDTLQGGEGADRLDGGVGRDTASHAGASGGVRADLSSPSGNTGDAKGDAYTGIENLEGSLFADMLLGDAAANLLSGLDGADQLYGRAGNDTLSGGDGDDTLMGGTGADRLEGGAGVDVASYGESRALRVDLATPGLSTGEAAGDVYEGIEGLAGGKGNDTLAGDAQGNVLSGGGGNDQLDGRTGDDSLLGGDGTDTLVGGEGADRLDGGIGNDRLDGGEGEDTLIGGDGNDILVAGAQADRLEGGLGWDVATYAGGQEGVDLSLGQPALNAGGAAGDVLLGVEEVIGTAYADRMSGDGQANVLRGEVGADWLSGGAGADTLYGGDGDDTLQGGEGADRLDGGAGRDTASHAGASGGVRADLSSPSGNTGDAKGDAYTGIENLEGSLFADTLLGDAAANLLSGLDGADQLYGRAGNDTLSGGDGDDTLLGGTGADRLEGGAGIDVASYGESRALRVDLATPGLSTGEAAGDVYEGIEGLAGGKGNDTLAGDAQGNVLSGGGGNDQLDGRTGDDNLLGGDGTDTLVGGEGADRLDGGIGNDRLDGGAGEDTLIGGDGNDWMDGGASDDILTGGAGTDTFVFRAGYDVVTDFQDGQDQIVLDDGLWDGVAPDVATVLACAEVTEFGLRFDLGDGNTLDIVGIFDANLLADNIQFA